MSAKQPLFKVHMNPRIQSYYEMAKPNEQHLFDLLCMLFDVFDGNTFKYILIGNDIASRYKVASVLRTNKASKVAFLSEVMCKRAGVFKYPQIFQCDNGSDFKSDMTKLYKKTILTIEE